MSKDFQDADQKNYTTSNLLELNEQYFENYNKYIVRLLLTEALSANAKVLDFGAGIGALASVAHNQFKIKPDCIELDPNQAKVLVNKGFDVYENINQTTSSYDLIYSSNVLEHIKDDLTALKMLNAKLTPKGRLTLYVPAFEFLYNNVDKSVGHYRRYTKKTLKAKLIAAGFHVEVCEYSDSVGFFIWYLYKLLGTKEFKISNDGFKIKIFDSFLFPISLILDKLGAKYFFGKSLYVVAGKNN